MGESRYTGVRLAEPLMARQSQVVEISEVHHVLETTMNSFAILFNIVLLYLVRWHSTSQMSMYKLLLTVDASLDLALAVIAFLGQPVYFTGENYFVSVARGPLAVLCRPLSGFLLLAYCFVFLLNLIWIPAQFAYRCIILCYPQRQQAMFRLVPVVVVIWSAIGLAAIYPVYRPPPEFQAIGTRVLQNMRWPVDVDGTEPVLGAPLGDWRMLIYVSMWMASSMLCVSVVIACEHKMLRFLGSYGDNYTKHTRQMHKEFHRALLAMAICPLVSTTIPVFFFATCMVFSLNPGQVSAIVSTSFATITVLNPLTTMVFMRCYRRVVVKALCGETIKRRVAPSDVNDASTAGRSASAT